MRKSFGPTAALDGVDFTVLAGEVHALVGENGAGKSTLMGILGGSTRADAGSITLDGAPYAPRHPREARDAGVMTVHQELSLCPHLTVEENILLGIEPSRFGVLDRRAARLRTESLLARVVGDAARLRPADRVGDLSTGDQQFVEIARALEQAGSAGRVLIFDEPTSSLSAGDVRRLFALISSLRSQGMAVVYISHFLEEVLEIADRFTVMRDGKTVGSGTTKGAKASDLVGLMAGRKVDQLFPRSARAPGEVILSSRELAGLSKPRSASFELRRGEVLGIAGIVGAGRTELVRAIFGLDRVRSGEVRVAGLLGPASPARRLASGVGMLSEDRKSEGLAGSLSVAENLTLSRLDGFGPMGLVFERRERRAAQRWMDRLSIRARDPRQAVRDLSGGNQQKVALARLLHHDVDVFLLDEPTRGIDVASKAQIYALIDELACSGKAVLLISSYLPELLGIADRIAVMKKGTLGMAHPASELDEHALLAEATGA